MPGNRDDMLGKVLSLGSRPFKQVHEPGEIEVAVVLHEDDAALSLSDEPQELARCLDVAELRVLLEVVRAHLVHILAYIGIRFLITLSSVMTFCARVRRLSSGNRCL
jgi:hypothetical protein